MWAGLDCAGVPCTTLEVPPTCTVMPYQEGEEQWCRRTSGPSISLTDSKRVSLSRSHCMSIQVGSEGISQASRLAESFPEHSDSRAEGKESRATPHRLLKPLHSYFIV